MGILVFGKDNSMRILSILAILILGFSATSRGQTDDGLPDMSFLNRGGSIEMGKELMKVFPPGTSRDFVHRALVEKGGAKYEGQIKPSDLSYTYFEANNVHKYRYRRPFYLRFLHDGRFTIVIHYDENDRVKSKLTTRNGKTRNPISVSGPTGL